MPRHILQCKVDPVLPGITLVGSLRLSQLSPVGVTGILFSFVVSKWNIITLELEISYELKGDHALSDYLEPCRLFSIN